MMTTEELALAKAQLKKIQVAAMTPDEQMLIKRYPGLTLEAAKVVDNSGPLSFAPLPGQVIHDCGQDFLRIRRQETGPFSAEQ